MCGIAGIFHPDCDFPISRMILQKMTDILIHRGPDDEGHFVTKNIGLGHRRLSIIDIDGGKQPIFNEDHSICTVFNGEIFNFIELMETLKSKGHSFKTRCDTEVIVHLYEEYGSNFVNFLNGQFAIALWDNNNKELILARDRVGIRPLFYTHLKDGSFLFGSEMKALFCHPQLTPAIDFIGLEQILTLWVTVPPRTIFSGVRELAPGCLLQVSSKGVFSKKYWSVIFPDRKEYDIKSNSYYTEQTRELLYNSVMLRLRADVTVASYLSGGLDSSIITTLAKKYHNNNLLTFSVCFKDKKFDETAYQRIMIEYLNTDHKTICVDYNSIAEIFPQVIWHTEYPTIRTAPAPLFLLSSLVKNNNIKVVLTGEGADEVFGGYNIFKENLIRRFWARNPESVIRPHLLKRLYPYVQGESHNKFWELFFKKFLLDTTNPYYSHLIRWSSSSKIKQYIHPDIQNNFNEELHIFAELDNYIEPTIKRWHPLCQSQYLEMKLFMPGYLLSSQGDRMTMGNSIEGRFPFLDHNVIEFANSIPPEYKINILNEKFILKKTYANILPSKIIERQKQPYRAPISKVFTNNDKTLPARLISSKSIKLAGIFNNKMVSTLINKCKSYNQISEIDDMSICAIVSTQILHHHFIQPIEHNPSTNDIIITNSKK